MKKDIIKTIYYNNSRTIYGEKVDKNDTLNNRNYCPAYCIYHDKPARQGKKYSKIHYGDKWYRSKEKATMYHNHKASKEIATDYYIDYNNGTIYKKKEALRYLVKHNLPIREDDFIHCTKSQALKKLEKATI